MREKIRKTGSDIIGDVPWGTHFCQFYQNKEDLTDILVPYFKEGLESNEFCVWITSEPLSEKEAKKAMRKALPNFDRYLTRAQIEIVPYTELYLKDSVFNLQRVLKAWIDKLSQALAKGYDGMRVTSNTAWLEKKDWRIFADYEEEVNNAIGKYRMIALCTYCLDKCGVVELIDVVRTHQFALIRREGEWELIESSKRKKAEEEIEALSRFRSEYPNPVLRVADDGTVLYANDAGKKIFKAEVGKKMSDHYLPILKKAIASEQYVNFEEQVGERYFSSVVKSIPKLGYLNMYSKDITERKKAQGSLIQSERLKALGEMAGGVAHDFNNLLAIILGNAQLLEKGLKRYKLEEIKERLKIIARTAYEGGKIVRRLQHFTHTEILREEFTQLDLNEIVRSALDSTSPRWKDEAEARGITIKIKENLGEVPLVLGSRSELMEVLTNLIFNSIEAMKKGGEITIRTEAKENEVFLYFTDTGKGVPDNIKKKIFDPFFTTKGPKASGLGLSVSYGIVKRHRGEIKVESIKGKGTTFTISIPISSEAPLKKEKLKEPEEVSSRKILVIDDEKGIREVLGRIFQQEGHRVTLAETSKKGLDEFKQDNFDLVLTDLGMPEMSGWQLAKKIKEIDPGTPVGLITGWTVAFTKEKMKEEEVDFILSKPFDYAKVLREINAALKSKKR